MADGNQTTPVPVPEIYYTKTIINFEKAYYPLHCPTVIAICTFGILTNIMNIVVLTRRVMLSSPTNILLLGLSSAQLFLLINFFGFTMYTKVIDTPYCNLDSKTYGWLLYLALNVNMNFVLHTVALIHTSLLAVFRYLVIHFPTKRIVTVPRVKGSVFATFVVVPLLCTSFYANTEIVHEGGEHIFSSMREECNLSQAQLQGVYQINFKNMDLMIVNFWIFGIFAKILPCLCLSALSFALIWDMKVVEKRRKILLGNRKSSDGVVDRQRSTTTTMLLVIVCLFISVELPQGVLAFLTAYLPSEFRVEIYSPLGDVFEMLTVLYSSLNFLLYCVMSSQFRKTFKQLFFHRTSEGMEAFMMSLKRQTAVSILLNLNKKRDPEDINDYKDANDYKDDAEEESPNRRKTEEAESLLHFHPPPPNVTNNAEEKISVV